MAADEMMVVAVNGFLEAGKTALIRDLLLEELYERGAKTLILVCEEGEEEYGTPFLKEVGASIEYIEDEDSFNGKVMAKFLKKHRPDRIFIEYNGMWNASRLIEMFNALEDICVGMRLMVQSIDVVNDETYALYMKNMPSLMVEHFRYADLVVCNRCSLQTSKTAIRGVAKSANPRIQIAFESEDEAFYEMKEELPYDLDADVVEITDDNFGVWYMDMLDNPDTYEGKTIKVTGVIQKVPDLAPGFVVFGRFAMTCCADDIQYLGLLAHGDFWEAYNTKDYVTIICVVRFENQEAYGETGPVFYCEKGEKAEKPKEEVVYFN